MTSIGRDAPQVEAAGMLREPDVSSSYVAFVHAGKIWMVAKSGGMARRLTSGTDPRSREATPRFSPDGRWIAFSADYEGSRDLYVIDAEGSEHRRLTFHPAGDRLLGWYPDGCYLLFASSRQSAHGGRYRQLYRVAAGGGAPEALPLPYGEHGDVSPDGRFLAFQIFDPEETGWKGYRGGQAPDLYLHELGSGAVRVRRLTRRPASESRPVWWGNDRLLLLSDWQQGHRWWSSRYLLDLWCLEPVRHRRRGKLHRLTRTPDFDIRWPAVGPRNAPTDLVYERGGLIYRVELGDDPDWLPATPVPIEIPRTSGAIRPRSRPVGRFVESATLSPDGGSVVFAARGGLFRMSTRNGGWESLRTRSDSAARSPALSPCSGRWLAYHCDERGEYDLIIRDLENGSERRLELEGGFRYRICWSPDERRLAWADHRHELWVADREGGAPRRVDKLAGATHPVLQRLTLSWSPDGRWLVYPRWVENRNRALFVYDGNRDKVFPLTSGYFNDEAPCFSRDGRWIFYLSRRAFNFFIGEVGYSWIYTNTRKIVALPWNPAVIGAGEGSSDHFRDLERQAVVLAVPSGRFSSLAPAAGGRLFYHRQPSQGATDSKSPLYLLDPTVARQRETEDRALDPCPIAEDVDGFVPSGDGTRVLVSQGGRYYLIDALPGQELKTPLPTGHLEKMAEPDAERRQIFDDCVHLTRDYFYVPKSKEAAWLREFGAAAQRYRRRLGTVPTRRDLNDLVGELLSELRTSHVRVSGGDFEPMPADKADKVGLLGADLVLGDRGLFRFARIFDPGPYESERRSPLLHPVHGRPVAPGEALLAVDGQALDPGRDPWAAFAGHARQEVRLTVGEPGAERTAVVRTLTGREELDLRLRAWMESNRRWVEQVSGGLLGYVFIPDTSWRGQPWTVRQFQAQYHKPGLIFDARFNLGGNYPDTIIEMIGRPRTARYLSRHMELRPQSEMARSGPQTMLINRWSGSGGDLLPYLFREAGMGELIGTRTWGGVVSSFGVPGLIDGGSLTIPNQAFRDPRRRQGIENRGISPTLPVNEDLEALAAGRDAQLEAAVAHLLRTLLDSRREDYSRRLQALREDEEVQRILGATLDPSEFLTAPAYRSHPSPSKKGKTASSGRSRSAASSASASSPLNRLWR